MAAKSCWGARDELSSCSLAAALARGALADAVASEAVAARSSPRCFARKGSSAIAAASSPVSSAATSAHDSIMDNAA
eukprot:4732115-Pyramimonas_sp.AAC.1